MRPAQLPRPGGAGAAAPALALVLLLVPLPVAAANVPACGRLGQEASSSRIVNGRDSPECRWRWQVSLRTAWGTTHQHFCGGTLINESWVLTAAHCEVDLELPYVAVLGDTHRSTSHGDRHEQVIRVRNVVDHPLFNDDTLEFDFTLLELETPADLGPCIGAACLPAAEEEEVSESATCWTTGWGAREMGDEELPDVLQEAQVNIVSTAACNDAYPYGIGDMMMCAQGQTDAGLIADACQGDSGGPLVCEAADGSWVLQGVTSWGRGCGLADYPGVWARVSSVTEWISEVMADPPSLPRPADVPACCSTDTCPCRAFPDQLCLADDGGGFKCRAVGGQSACLEAGGYWSGCPPVEPACPIPEGSAWTVCSGPCQLDGSCISSDNFPNEYSHNTTCAIAVDPAHAGRVSVMNFSTESYFDFLIVNGNHYSGTDIPAQLEPSGDIFWSADVSVTDLGWKICMEATTSTAATTSVAEVEAKGTTMGTLTPTATTTTSATASEGWAVAMAQDEEDVTLEADHGPRPALPWMAPACVWIALLLGHAGRH